MVWCHLYDVLMSWNGWMLKCPHEESIVRTGLIILSRGIVWYLLSCALEVLYIVQSWKYLLIQSIQSQVELLPIHIFSNFWYLEVIFRFICYASQCITMYQKKSTFNKYLLCFRDGQIMHDIAHGILHVTKWFHSPGREDLSEWFSLNFFTDVKFRFLLLDTTLDTSFEHFYTNSYQS